MHRYTSREILNHEAEKYDADCRARDAFEYFARNWAPSDPQELGEFYRDLHQIVRATFSDAHELAARPMEHALKSAFSVTLSSKFVHPVVMKSAVDGAEPGPPEGE